MFEQLLNKKCDINIILSPSSRWGDGASLPLLEGNVPCRIEPISGNEQFSFCKMRSEATHKIFMNYRKLEADYLIYIEGKYYRIIPPIGFIGGEEYHLELIVKELSKEEVDSVY